MNDFNENNNNNVNNDISQNITPANVNDQSNVYYQDYYNNRQGYQQTGNFSDSFPTQDINIRNNTAPKQSDKVVKVMSKKTATVIIAASIILSMGIGFGGGFIAKTLTANNNSVSSGDAAKTDNKDDELVIQKVVNTVNKTDDENGAELKTSEIAEVAADSVVEIRTETVVTGGYFVQQYVSEGAGSGVIISEDGYIITNHHVIDGATNINITLRNGETYTAEVIGSDSEIDVALLKIDATGLKAAVIGSSANLKVGEDIVAIGNPLGQLGGTVTEGIISALDRDITIDGITNSLLQISAAINPGNSGGGVFNSKGELIALVVAKANSSSSGTSVEGLGFAIHIDDVVNVIGDLKQYGYVKGRVALDATLLNITSQDMAWRYRVNDLGVYVYQSNNDALKSGDRIISVEGKNISSSEDISSVLKEHKVGDKLKFVIERDGSEMKIDVELIEKTQD